MASPAWPGWLAAVTGLDGAGLGAENTTHSAVAGLAQTHRAFGGWVRVEFS